MTRAVYFPRWHLLMDTLLDVELWKSQQSVFWHFWFARRGLPRNGFVLDMWARTFRVQDIFARAIPAGTGGDGRAPGTMRELQATKQQVAPSGHQTPVPREHGQAPRTDGIDDVLLGELNRVGLLTGMARRSTTTAAR